MKIKTPVTILFFAIISASCAQAVTAVPTTLIPLSSATSITQSPTVSKYFNNEIECVQAEIMQGLPILQSTLATFEENSNNIELWNLETNNKTVLGRVAILSGAMSNFQKIAYIDADENQVKIVSQTGEILSVISAPKNWVEILDWTNEKNLLIGAVPFLSNGGWNPPSSTIFHDIASGKNVEFLPEYPNIYKYISGPPDFGNYSYSLTAYDPSLKRVIYPASNSDYEYLVLWDIPNHKEVARFYILFPFSEIQWNRDGAFFIASLPPYYKDSYGNTYKNVHDELPYVGGNELFLISRTGEIKRLTFLTTKYEIDEFSLSWSPNNDYVAFWLKIGIGTPEWQLAILKIKTEEITSFCVDGEGSLPIIWSPDGNQLMSTTYPENIANRYPEE